MPRSLQPVHLGVVALLLTVLAVYANHFQNAFHYDDFHTITTNVYIADLRNIPRFFTDASLFTREPANASYRPLTSTSLAIDYWLAGGFHPFFFHLTTFIWFAVQVLLLFFLFRRILDLADPHPSNPWTALAATACYALHPVNAETVNYIIQRADLYTTLGVVASLLWFAARPDQRRWGWYLIPALLACLSKAPALVFPLILLAYLWLFEAKASDKNPGGAALLASAPAFLAAAAAAFLTVRMTPATFNGGASSVSLYLLTQPWIALRYCQSFFLPTGLSVTGEWRYTDPGSLPAVAGYLFVIGLVAAAFSLSRRPELRPISFGIFWFLLALAPTSLTPLEEVANDHRMFFPFVGLALAVVWSLRMLLFRTARLSMESTWLRATVALAAIVLAAEAAGTRQRNQVWHTEESLWLDATIKHPDNGIALLTYGGTFLERGDYSTALTYYDRAAAYIPNHWVLAANQGLATSGLERDAEAEQHFRRAIQLAPAEPDPYFLYGRWLKSKGRLAESQGQLEAAVRVNPLSFPARYLLMEVYSQQGSRAAYDALLKESLQLGGSPPASSSAATGSDPGGNPEAMLHQSAEYCRAGKYQECIDAARKAIALKPDYAEAYNNIAASSIALHRPDDAVRAASEAVRIRPDFELAQKNLQRALALQQTTLQQRSH